MSIISVGPIRILPFATAFASTLLASCGGGGDSSSAPSPTPVSTAPRFTSGPTTSVVENTGEAFYNATASDPQGDTISFSVFSGSDADKFVIDGSGALRFNSPPNYDLPSDSNLDNVYNVTLRALAGGETATLNLTITVTNDREGIAVKRVVTGIVNPVDMAFVHNEPTLLVAERGGRVLRVDPVTGSFAEDTYIRDAKRPGENIAIAFAFPGRRNQEGVYLLTHDAQDGLWLQGFNEPTAGTGYAKLGDANPEPFTASMFPQRELYIAIGDPSGNDAQNLSSPYGKLMQGGLYDPYGGASLRPASDMVVGASTIGDGIHRPGGFTPNADFLFLADSGASLEHELTIFRRDWRPLDFGWPFYEGSQATRSNPPAAVNGPTLVYGVGSGFKQGDGIIAGRLNDYRHFETLGDTYVFADTNGTIWSVPRSLLIDGFRHSSNEFEDRSEDFVPDEGTIDSPIAFASGTGSDHFYILDSDGEIFRVEAAQS